jgi:hypothetical protein
VIWRGIDAVGVAFELPDETARPLRP